MKVSIIGCGNVGKAVFSFLVSEPGIDEIALIGRDEARTEAEALDMRHAMPLLSNRRLKIVAGANDLLKGSNVVIITSGVPLSEIIDTKEKLAAANKGIVLESAANIERYCIDAKVIVVSNPVEAMTFTVIKGSSIPACNVIGTGTLNDTSRLIHYLADSLAVVNSSIEAYVFGEHVTCNFIPWSLVRVNHLPLSEYCKAANIPEPCRDEAHEYINRSAFGILREKGNTTYSIAAAVVKIVRAVIYDESSLLPVAAYLSGQQGFNDIVISLPCIINKNGVGAIRELELNTDERAALNNASESIGKITSLLFG